MRLYVLELKRLLKTRSVSFLLIAALVLSAVMAYVPVTYIQAYKTDKSGNIEAVSGREAIKVKRADKKALQGEMTEAKIRETITDIKEVLKEYGSLSRQDIPLEVYVQKVYPHLDIIPPCGYKNRSGIHIDFCSICGRNGSLFHHNASTIWRRSI